MKRILLIAFALLAPLAASAYVVQPGDTLWKISQEYNTDVATLAELNGLVNPDLIHVGQLIDVPLDELFVFGATPTPSSSADRKYVEIPDTSLFTGAIVGDESITLDKLVDIYNNSLTMDDFGTKGYGRLNPEGDNISEAFSFTGITSNANGTVTLTGVSSTLARYPYTESAGVTRSHGIGSIVRLTNTAAFYNDFANKENDEIIEGLWRFTQLPTSTEAAPTLDSQLVNKKYVDDTAFAGAPDASLIAKGISELATGLEAASSTAAGGGDTTAPLVLHADIATSSCEIAEYGIPVLGADGKMAASCLDQTDVYSWSNGHTFTSSTHSGPSTIQGDLTANGETVIASSTITTLNIDSIAANQLVDGSVIDSSVHSHQGIGVLIASSTTQQSLSNASETTLYSGSVPANTLSTGNALYFEMDVSDLKVTNGGQNILFNMKYGATTVASITLTNNAASNITGLKGKITGKIIATGATNSQYGVLEIDLTTSGVVIGSNIQQAVDIGEGTGTEDSTGALTFAISADLSQHGANDDLTVENFILYSIQEQQ